MRWLWHYDPSHRGCDALRYCVGLLLRRQSLRKFEHSSSRETGAFRSASGTRVSGACVTMRYVD